MLQVKAIIYGWQVTWDLTDFSELFIKGVPAQFMQGHRRKTGVQPGAFASMGSDQ